MGKVVLEPYIFFKGQAKEAMEFYKDVFGGELSMQTYGDTPPETQKQMGITAENRNNVMHAKLEGDVVIMGSDTPNASPEAKKIELSIGGNDTAKIKGYFEKLSKGGKVNQPLKKQFWGDTFGQLTDKYKVDWMFNITSQK
jgi:PhnB protein